MTKSELKEIIQECIDEINEEKLVEESVDINDINEDSYVMESDEYDAYCIAEARAYIEALEEADMDESLNEAENTVKNISIFHKALKDAKDNTREAKRLIKEDNTKEAKKKIDDTIDNLDDAKYEIEHGNNIGFSLATTAIYCFVPFVDLAIEIYGNIMANDKSNIAKVNAVLKTASDPKNFKKAIKKAANANKVTHIFWTSNTLFKKKYHVRAMGSKEGLAAFAKQMKKIDFVFQSLKVAATIANIIQLIKIIYQIRFSRKNRPDGGIIEIKLGSLIDNYIAMLEKLKASIN